MRKTFAAVCGVLLSGGLSLAGLINFDDLPNEFEINNGYGGLNWANIWAFKVYPHGTVSKDTAAVPGYWGGNSIYAPVGHSFTLNSAYLTSLDGNDLTVVVEGYLGNALAWTDSYSVTGSLPELFFFGSGLVDSVGFIVRYSYGGREAQVIIDNLDISLPDGGFTAAMLGMALLPLAFIGCRFPRCAFESSSSTSPN